MRREFQTLTINAVLCGATTEGLLLGAHWLCGAQGGRKDVTTAGGRVPSSTASHTQARVTPPRGRAFGSWRGSKTGRLSSSCPEKAPGGPAPSTGHLSVEGISEPAHGVGRL